MIPIDEIRAENLYSQHDAEFLLGKGFSKRGAKEFVREACHSGQLSNRFYRKRYWFTGAAFLEWVGKWSGIDLVGHLDFNGTMDHNRGDDNRLGAARREVL